MTTPHPSSFLICPLQSKLLCAFETRGFRMQGAGPSRSRLRFPPPISRSRHQASRDCVPPGKAIGASVTPYQARRPTFHAIESLRIASQAMSGLSLRGCPAQLLTCPIHLVSHATSSSAEGSHPSTSSEGDQPSVAQAMGTFELQILGPLPGSRSFVRRPSLYLIQVSFLGGKTALLPPPPGPPGSCVPAMLPSIRARPNTSCMMDLSSLFFLGIV